MTLPNSISIGIRNGIRTDGVVESFDFDIANASDPVLAYLLEYGLKQSAGDAAASKETPDDKAAASRKRLQDLSNGIVPAGGSSSGPSWVQYAQQFALDFVAKRGAAKRADVVALLKGYRGESRLNELQQLFGEIIHTALADKLDIAESEVPEADIEAAVEKNWDKFVVVPAKAKADTDRENATTSIEL